MGAGQGHDTPAPAQLVDRLPVQLPGLVACGHPSMMRQHPRFGNARRGPALTDAMRGIPWMPTTATV